MRAAMTMLPCMMPAMRCTRMQVRSDRSSDRTVIICYNGTSPLWRLTGRRMRRRITAQRMRTLHARLSFCHAPALAHRWDSLALPRASIVRLEDQEMHGLMVESDGSASYNTTTLYTVLLLYRLCTTKTRSTPWQQEQSPYHPSS